VDGYMTLTGRESGHNTHVVNLDDLNAHGERMSDGAPAGSSRGAAQCVPGTFAAYHQPGTSRNIYDPVANVAASMNYVMGRYDVAADGSDLAARVAQANPRRSPHGY
jgi:SLT domain-containing protein